MCPVFVAVLLFGFVWHAETMAGRHIHTNWMIEGYNVVKLLLYLLFSKLRKCVPRLISATLSTTFRTRKSCCMDRKSPPEADNASNPSIFSWMKSKKFTNHDEPGEPEAPKGPNARKVKFLSLYRYATPLEKVYFALSMIAAAMHGACMPLITVIFG